MPRCRMSVSIYAVKWGRMSDWYQTNFAGGVYKGKVYGICYETIVNVSSVRGRIVILVLSAYHSTKFALEG